MNKKEYKERMYKLQDFLDFFGRLDNPFTEKSMEGYNKGIEYLKKKYPNEYDIFIKILEDKDYIKQSPNVPLHLELTREGQIFIDDEGFIKPYIKEKNTKEKFSFFNVVKISAGIAAVYYLMQILIIVCHYSPCAKQFVLYLLRKI